MPKLWERDIMGFTKSSNVRVVGGPIIFYEEYTLTNLYVSRSFNAKVNNVTVMNDSFSDVCQVSWDGATLSGDIKPGETMTFSTSTKTEIYLKGTAGGDKVRCWGW